MNKISTIVRIAVVALALASLTACVTRFQYPPRSTEPTLAIARCELTGSQENEVRRFLINGGPSVDYQFHFVEEGTDEEDGLFIMRRSGSSEFVGSNRFEAGAYEMIKIRLVSDFQGERAWVDVEPGDRPHITIRSGSVNNLGTFVLEFVGQRRVRLDLDDNQNEIESAFREQFPDSEWNDFEWISTAVRYQS